MRIKKIKLNNFGIHRDLEFVAEDKPVVGLIGKNGSGKSTILDAVKFGLTGELEGKLEDAVTVGRKKGYVELTIEKNGEDIFIKREVGKSPKREFKRGDKELTASKDIDLAIAEVLAVDKVAMSNACFLKQGSLNELLFGTEAAREKLFVKLVNLSFCEKYGAIVDKKIQNLQAGVEDLHTLGDEVNAQRMDAVVKKELLEKELSRTVDYSKALTIIADNKVLNAHVKTVSSELKDLQDTVTADKAMLGSILLGFAVSDRSKLEEKLKESRNDLEALIANKSELVDKKNLKIQYENTLSQITETKKDLEIKEAKLAETVQALDTLAIPDIHLDELNNELGVLNLEIRKKGEWLSIQYNHTVGEDRTCEYCGQVVDITDDELLDIEKKFEAVVFKRKEVEEKVREEKEVFMNYESKKSELVKAYGALEAEVKQLSTQFNNLTKLIQSLLNGANVSDPTDDIATASKNIEDASGLVTRCEKSLIEAIAIDSRLTTNEALLVSKKASVDINYTKSVNNTTELEAELDRLDLSTLKGIDEAKLKLEIDSRQKARTEAVGRLKEAAENFTNLNDRHIELQQRIEHNKGKLIVVEELREIKEILSRKGLPRAVVNNKFDKLVVLTSNNLAILNADFSVSKDPDSFLSFVFQRFDGHEHVVLPMSRLSGGQKVRLCIAFLLAVQQELVPEVGFQTFDEPSTHLDEDGVERLCSMFKSLQDLLRCVNHQVWICDHNPLLEESFNTTLRL